jgi:hypothetical protein
MRIKLILFMTLALCGSALAQDDKANPDAQVQTVADDDGCRAYILGLKIKPLTDARRIPTQVITGPQQYSIFLGSDWSTPELRTRESNLSALLSSIRSQSEAAKVSQQGVQNFYSATYSQEVLTDFSADQNVSDLRVRAILAELVNSNSLQRPNAATLYVIYLAPGLRSTLGSFSGRKHYLAYHDFFNIAGQRMHYVVMPYEPDLKTARGIALRALVVAALNPNRE